MNKKDLISIRDLSNDAILSLFEIANSFNSDLHKRLKLANDALMAALFYEPSTRTRMSFESAMLRLGGQVINMTDPMASSASKGETLADTVRIIENYTDIIVLRHPSEGAAKISAENTTIPVINAGDGAREHPTQTLLDLYTIFREKGTLEGVKVALCGDLKHGRTVHSLAQGLSRFGAKMICVAPHGLEMPADLSDRLIRKYNAEFVSYNSLQSAPLDDCDVLYVTRVQKERFADPLEFESVKKSYVVSKDTLKKCQSDTIILHPLPRVDELDYTIDDDPRAAYFRQAAYGVPVRMALIAAMLGLVNVSTLKENQVSEVTGVITDNICGNPRCISRNEPIAKHSMYKMPDGLLRCSYCEKYQEMS
ncbi:MAG: aspartate carbamoyltransferase [bacterium]